VAHKRREQPYDDMIASSIKSVGCAPHACHLQDVTGKVLASSRVTKP
jgi:hypothetical protein